MFLLRLFQNVIIICDFKNVLKVTSTFSHCSLLPFSQSHVTFITFSKRDNFVNFKSVLKVTGTFSHCGLAPFGQSHVPFITFSERDNFVVFKSVLKVTGTFSHCGLAPSVPKNFDMGSPLHILPKFPEPVVPSTDSPNIKQQHSTCLQTSQRNAFFEFS